MSQEQEASPAVDPPMPQESEETTDAIDQLVDLLQQWLPAPLVEVWDRFLANPLLEFLALILLGYLIGLAAQFVVGRGLRRITAKTPTDLDDHLIELSHRPIFFTFFLGGMAIAIRGVLDGDLGKWTVNILQTVLVLSWLGAGVPFCGLILERLSRYRERFPLVEERTIPLFDITAKVILFGGASYVVLLVWDIDPTGWLASAGVVGLAVGFAAKDTLANLFSGFFIIADAPYKIGDFIVLDSGERGRVTHVGIRSTRLETRDDIQVTIPNAAIANAKIINESGGKWERERIRIKVGVAYGSDVDQVCEVLKRLAIEHDHICPEPAPRVRMRAFGDSSLDFELLCWIDEPVLRGKLTHELLMEVYKTFNREGIEIPYPKRDVYLHHVPESGGDGQRPVG